MGRGLLLDRLVRQGRAFGIHVLLEEIGKPYQLDVRMISGAEAEQRQPGSTRPWKGALYSPSDGRAEPFKAVAAMAEAARRKGAKIFTNCAVRGLETSAGRVSVSDTSTA